MSESGSDPEQIDELEDFFVSADEATVASYVGEFQSQVELSRDVAELLTFWIGEEEFAIDILEIQEILKVPQITPVPRVAAAVLGITSLRGTIVPVVDMRVFLGVERKAPGRESRVLVLQAKGDPVGLLVDRVVSVSRLERDSIEAVPRTMQRDASEALEGVGRVDDRLLIVLNLDAVLAFLERQE